MQKSGVAFGTSGARGLVSGMTDEVCYGYTRGFLQFMGECEAWQTSGRVALAGDLRPSTPRILAACAKAVRDIGGEPVFCGYVPTPALACWAFEQGIPSIMVTGSHIPDDRNGIKFYRPDGEILKEDEPGILRQVIGGDILWDETGAILPSLPLPVITDIAAHYIARYVKWFGPNALAGLRVGVYQHSAVGRDLVVDILSDLGAQVLPFGRSEVFVPVDTEAVRHADIVLARQWAAENAVDAIVSTDGDSDRPLLADHRGEWLRGDVLGVLCARALRAGTVVTPVSSNTVVEKCNAFRIVRRTRIGSPYVIADMNAAQAAGEGMVCGYEANGGFLLATPLERGEARLPALPTRDAVLPVVTALLAARPRRLADLVADMPQRFTYSDRIPEFSANRRDALMDWLLHPNAQERDALMQAEFGTIAGATLSAVNLIDGVRMTFSNERIIHLPGSGNAPELRCYTEAETPEIAAAVNRKCLDKVSERF